ncbi:DUF2155 domain-containing protein [Brevundimonas naejangsanensis]|uniref:DUF2155 domain-containing protein n=1 Tax=Brevundimonas naejangsanensis TaxID=588932 RepID=A0A494RIJ7_9CAUL|nr:DUF2155 domain-containing protein [Brevundimonas naejangsanensis]AYG96201.1 DUF2155 domain-containing protein [Brevundimonas naejangsanensis]
MNHRRVLLTGVVVAGLAISGAGVASALMDLPQDATPVSQDPVGDRLRDAARTPSQPAPQTSAQPAPQPGQATSPAAPAPNGQPVVLAPTAAPVLVAPGQEVAAVQEEVPEEAPVEETVQTAPEPTATPGRRQRRPVAVIQAVDKTTAETMRFEVEVGGRPVRFGKTLIFKARACEISASDELTEDAIAYLEVGIQPRGVAVPTEARQIFKGWMFASSPGVNGLQHPVYDAWVVGCKA